MKLIVNGVSREIISETNSPTLEELLKQIKYHPQLVVVELNGIIINPKNLKNQIIKDGDILEIVTIVGGGS